MPTLSKRIVALSVCLTFSGAALVDSRPTSAQRRTVRIKGNPGLHTDTVIEDLSLVDHPTKTEKHDEVCVDGGLTVGCLADSKLDDQLPFQKEVPTILSEAPTILPEVIVATPTKCVKPPSPVAHAKLFHSEHYGKKVPCSNAIDVGLDSNHSHCNVECEQGYELLKNDLVCQQRGDPLSFSWGQIVGQAVCMPVNCGSPSTLAHASSSKADIIYPDSFTYTCLSGYSLDGTTGGPKKQSIQCLASGDFSFVDSCKPVRCGKCPAHPDSKVVDDARRPRVYSESCHYECANGFSLDRRAAGRKEFTAQCMASGHFSVPESCQPVACGAPPADVAHAAMTAPRGSSIVYPESVEYACNRGYSLTGAYGTQVKFLRKCQADGRFSARPTCKPNSCGHPPKVEHARYNDKELHFKETVRYTCEPGYTLTGHASGEVSKTLSCGHDGYWAEEELPECFLVA
eukprot:gnl/TRDRNA2_/TRDRNA2_129728_c0_seq1.p1 gnl/TRDRNA2_/TRDRNA2_129728_c0~~gnl/TRDRNA2_/TRDRNA2_129728_c0_seq1.p1  ORF type:complete len:457 (+),score=72.33 gnl/TRDRNA2_/TRDRNA2_129728_c0_seq1:101-1471(+)